MVNNSLLILTANKLAKKNLIPFVLISLLILISYVLPRDEYRTLLLFFVLIPIFTFYRYDWKIAIGYAIFLLILAAVFVSLGERNFANQMVIFSYWLLVVGCSCLAIEFFRKN